MDAGENAGKTGIYQTIEPFEARKTRFTAEFSRESARKNTDSGEDGRDPTDSQAFDHFDERQQQEAEERGQRERQKQPLGEMEPGDDQDGLGRRGQPRRARIGTTHRELQHVEPTERNPRRGVDCGRTGDVSQWPGDRSDATC